MNHCSKITKKDAPRANHCSSLKERRATADFCASEVSRRLYLYIPTPRNFCNIAITLSASGGGPVGSESPTRVWRLSTEGHRFDPHRRQCQSLDTPSLVQKRNWYASCFPPPQGGVCFAHGGCAYFFGFLYWYHLRTRI